MSFYLNNENYIKRTKFIDELKAQNIVIENIQFAGYPRCLAFIIESIIGLYFNIFMDNNNMKTIKMDYMIWCTYHDKKLIDEYQLKETSNFKLFYTKDNLDGYSLNYVQKYLCEWVTQYYVWKNNLKENMSSSVPLPTPPALPGQHIPIPQEWV